MCFVPRASRPAVHGGTRAKAQKRLHDQAQWATPRAQTIVLSWGVLVALWMCAAHAVPCQIPSNPVTYDAIALCFRCVCYVLCRLRAHDVGLLTVTAAVERVVGGPVQRRLTSELAGWRMLLQVNPVQCNRCGSHAVADDRQLARLQLCGHWLRGRGGVWLTRALLCNWALHVCQFVSTFFKTCVCDSCVVARARSLSSLHCTHGRSQTTWNFR
jgi:hypothetical protein